MEDNLFWKKYAPKTIEDIILLPRVRNSVSNGIKNNYIFYGSFGMGKTALSKILIKDNPSIKFNASLHTSIDNLRYDVDEFCSKMSLFDNPDAMKIVFLDEIERTSSAYQDALKGFIDEYQKNVRFVATTNHIQKVESGVLSRFISIDFNPKNGDEIKYLKKEYANRLLKISKIEEIEIETNDIVKLVNTNFPDLRQMVNILQHIKETGEINFNSSAFQAKMKVELFNHIMNNSDFIENYNFLMNNFGQDNISDLIYLLGRPFIEYSISKNPDLINNMPKLVDLVTEYSNMLPNVLDPIVLGVSLMGKVQEIIHSDK